MISHAHPRIPRNAKTSAERAMADVVLHYLHGLLSHPSIGSSIANELYADKIEFVRTDTDGQRTISQRNEDTIT